MLKEIKDNTIRHISNIDEFRKMAPIADARGMILINSGYIYDGALLRKLSESAFAEGS